MRLLVIALAFITINCVSYESQVLRQRNRQLQLDAELCNARLQEVSAELNKNNQPNATPKADQSK